MSTDRRRVAEEGPKEESVHTDGRIGDIEAPARHLQRHGSGALSRVARLRIEACIAIDSTEYVASQSKMANCSHAEPTGVGEDVLLPLRARLLFSLLAPARPEFRVRMQLAI